MLDKLHAKKFTFIIDFTEILIINFIIFSIKRMLICWEDLYRRYLNKIWVRGGNIVESIIATMNG